ncbi:MAG: amino acid racemase [Pseudomonadota bacterium]
MSEAIIGVVAGVGPYAGLDMLRKIFDQTIASGDQDHLTVVGWYQPSAVPDRTNYLLGQSNENPGNAIAQQLLALEKAGASIAAIPCNTAHAPAIFDTACNELKQQGSQLNVLHMINEVAAHLDYLNQQGAQIKRIGILSTTGTYDTAIYPNALAPLGYQAIVPPRDWQLSHVQQAIYDPEYGIKSVGYGTPQAREAILETMSLLRADGADAIILGCTELPLAFPERTIDELPLIDPTLVLARAVIREAAPNKLKPSSI